MKRGSIGIAIFTILCICFADCGQIAASVQKQETKSNNSLTKALGYLKNRLKEGSEFVYVYLDFSALSNRFT